MKRTNGYSKCLSGYARMPKAVLAAVAVSYAARLFEKNPEEVEPEILAEWAVLHRCGIVPQAPIEQRAREREV